ncbi:glycoside hydrolase family 35 protein [Ligilactobacillus murinus]|uniref:glycoside hydrolase family 35 protein n=1 Tax=Ligilactobacillus murinus TaxID=1622 RepID=UPI001094C4A6|nr:beta-galactosidase family protein [Ligilactobacillus murinus]TGY53290.1 beta-galactosidase [Ligilactobacillus murinus]
MENFIVREDGLYLNDEPFKLLSGAIHYFRIPREQWYRSLYNLKALGFNTVETYTAWNLHEPKEGVFDFSDRLDLKAFIELAQSLGLYVIVRPSPYICAEWEFGGLPAWLLTKENIRIRANDPVFLQAVERYYQELFQILTPLQITHGGPIIMMQIENEYGSYSEDKTYLRQIKALMEKYGADVALFTADGAWQATLRAGSLLEDKILATGNFGSHAKENFTALKAYQEKLGVKQPLICMEFWDGWFSRWGEPVVKRDQAELLAALREVLTLGAGVNLYMFHGGTNFGFMNGCSARRDHDLPQITSYDYGAPLNEAGEPTPTYYAIKELIGEMYPKLEQREPLVEKTLKVSDIKLTGQVDLFTCLEQVSEKYDSQYPQSMEALGSGYGYVLYRTQILRDKLTKERFRVIDARDRLGFYLDGEHVTTQYQEEIGEDIEAKLPNETGRLDILVENMGRVNYGSKLLANTQRKGLGRGVMADLHFILGWQQYVLNFDKLSALDFTGECLKGRPSFYRYEVELAEPGNCYLDLSGFGKGIALVNGHNLGRFWQKGPQLALFVPAEFLKQGKNEIVIFETEGIYQTKLNLVERPIYKHIEEDAQ